MHDVPTADVLARLATDATTGLTHAEAERLFYKFWVEPLPVTDLPTAAEHDRMLEKAKARSERAHDAT